MNFRPTLKLGLLTVLFAVAASAQLTIDAPAKVKAGSKFDIKWSGDAGSLDFITIIEKSAPPRQYGAYWYHKNGNPMKATAPDKPGEYELRWYAGQGYATRAAFPILVEAESASLEAPATAEASADISITWTGPANPTDFLTVVEAGAPERKYAVYVYTKNGNPLKLRMPDKAGEYELRYLTGQSYATLASRPITIGATSATVKAPAEAVGGERFPVEWTGPDHRGDFLTVVAKGAPERTWNSFQHTVRGSPAQVQAPDEPGEYEVRYLTGQSYVTLASAPIRITPPKNLPGHLRVISSGTTVDIPGGGAVEVILDASGSMLQRLDGARRIDIAKKVLTGLVTDTVPAGAPFALRVFGHREADSCRTDLEAPMKPLDPAALSALIGKVEAKNLAKTPIARSLELVAQDLAAAKGPRLVMLITDGEETCDGDPAAAIEKLRAAGVDVRVNIVGFAVDDANLKQTFRYWATVGGGSYFDATSAGQLAAAVGQALQSAYDVKNAQGEVVAEGIVGGDPVNLAPGSYSVSTRSAPPRTLSSVTVVSGETAVARLK